MIRVFDEFVYELEDEIRNLEENYAHNEVAKHRIKLLKELIEKTKQVKSKWDVKS